MPTEAIAAMAWLTDHVAHLSAETVLFIEDGAPVTTAAMRNSASRLSVIVLASQARRFAVCSHRPSILASALLACEAAQRELLLVPEAYRSDEAFLSAAGAEAMIDESAASVRVLGTASTPDSVAFAVLIPTSGTSGKPKIARHSLASLLGRIRPPKGSSAPRWLLTYRPVGFAGVQLLLTALTTGATLIGVAELHVPKLAEAAVTQGATHISGTPTFWRSFLLHLGSAARTLPLQQITLGGEIADQPTLDRLRAAFPEAAISHIYASTEAGALFSVRDGKAGFPADWLEHPVDGVSLRVEDGELAVLSARAMQGYVGREASRTANGWLLTGDRVEERDGRVYFLGRGDSIINVGGSKVTPEEIESALMDIDGIQDLRAFAVKNPITGAVVGLEVVAAPAHGREQIRKAVLDAAAQRLANYKVPRLVRFVDAIEFDSSGKKSRRIS